MFRMQVMKISWKKKQHYHNYTVNIDQLTMCFCRVHGVVSVLLFTRAIHKHGYFKFFLSLKLSYRKNIIRVSKKMLVSLSEMTVKQINFSSNLSTGTRGWGNEKAGRKKRKEIERVGSPLPDRAYSKDTYSVHEIRKQLKQTVLFILAISVTHDATETNCWGNSMGWAELFPTIHAGIV